MHRAERCVQNERLERNKRLVHDGAAKFQCTGAMQQHIIENILINKTMLIIWTEYGDSWPLEEAGFVK